jgi:hypothetical protein
VPLFRIVAMTVLTTTITTVGLPDTSTYTTIELVSRLVTPSAHTYGSEGWGSNPFGCTSCGSTSPPPPAERFAGCRRVSVAVIGAYFPRLSGRSIAVQEGARRRVLSRRTRRRWLGRPSRPTQSYLRACHEQGGRGRFIAHVRSTPAPRMPLSARYRQFYRLRSEQTSPYP